MCSHFQVRGSCYKISFSSVQQRVLKNDRYIQNGKWSHHRLHGRCQRNPGSHPGCFTRRWANSGAYVGSRPENQGLPFRAETLPTWNDPLRLGSRWALDLSICYPRLRLNYEICCTCCTLFEEHEWMAWSRILRPNTPIKLCLYMTCWFSVWFGVDKQLWHKYRLEPVPIVSVFDVSNLGFW